MLRRIPIVVVLVALVTMMATPVASAGKAGTDRPFRATMAGAAHWGFPGDSPSDCDTVTTITSATGNATHLGRIEAFWSHCPESEVVGDGRLTIIAANGDELYGTYDYDPSDVTNIIPITFSGGTGRFHDVSGSVDAAYSVEPQVTDMCTTDPFCIPVGGGFFLDFSVPWPWSATLTGIISY